jgi:Domain of unknown function (DUF4276)
VTELFFVVEGETEEEFINTVLVEHLAHAGVMARVVKVGRNSSGRGGMVSYARLRDHLKLLIAQRPNIWYTTMVDVFRLPQEFPGMDLANKHNDPKDRASQLEQSLLEDISALTGSRFFVPYVQLHEFEALLFTDPHTLDSHLTTLGSDSKLSELIAALEQYETPEHINNGPETAPSKRLEALYGKAYRKTVFGPLVTQAIGLERLREACPRFGAWVTRLEELR